MIADDRVAQPDEAVCLGCSLVELLPYHGSEKWLSNAEHLAEARCDLR